MNVAPLCSFGSGQCIVNYVDDGVNSQPHLHRKQAHFADGLSRSIMSHFGDNFMALMQLMCIHFFFQK